MHYVIVKSGRGFLVQFTNGRPPVRFKSFSDFLRFCRKRGLKPAQLLGGGRGYKVRMPAKVVSRAKSAKPAVLVSEDRTIPAIDESAFAPSPRAKAVLKGMAVAQEDLRSSGGSYDLEQVRGLMHGVSRQRIDKRVREGSLLAVPGPNNKRRFPAVQFREDGTVVTGLHEVQEALPTKNGFAILNFLIRPDCRLDDRKPIDLLKAGDVNLVVEAARRVSEQGA
jgi:hypothetical protein